jgi:hypothetical protein
MAKRTKLNIPLMQRVYQQTLSLAVAAKACGCTPATVSKYRDINKWVTKEQIAEVNKSNVGRDITLTPDIAIRLASGWRKRMQDNDLCFIIGITINQLKQWLVKNTEVTVIYNVESADGKIEKRFETIGLRNLKEKEWANFEFNSIQRQEKYRDEAAKAKMYGIAAGIDQWLLEKKIPQTYGRGSGVQVNVNNTTNNNQNNFIKIDSLNLPIETRKQILSAIKEKEILDEQENVKEIE